MLFVFLFLNFLASADNSFSLDFFFFLFCFLWSPSLLLSLGVNWSLGHRSVSFILRKLPSFSAITAGRRLSLGRRGRCNDKIAPPDHTVDGLQLNLRFLFSWQSPLLTGLWRCAFPPPTVLLLSLQPIPWPLSPVLSKLFVPFRSHCVALANLSPQAPYTLSFSLSVHFPKEKHFFPWQKLWGQQQGNKHLKKKNSYITTEIYLKGLLNN